MAAIAASFLAAAPAGGSDRQDLGQLQRLVEAYAKRETAGTPGGGATVTVHPLDARLALPRCASPEPFMPAGARLWGAATVGVRCAAPVAWTVYTAVVVEVHGEYLVTARPIAQGETVGPADVTTLRGDLAKLPPSVLLDPAHAIGKQPAMSLAAGQPLRRDMLRAPAVVVQGQTVRLVTRGPGFQVSAEGRALANAQEGQLVQVRAPSGSTVSGLARAGGIVEVKY
ncbi:MAG: flagellar basal body P-ring formation protein FlgA [Gammaproteobacteria bacterium]|nr:flagellar basal body P-ring formation protein FlgA [Gammaproteobacteria bacterium]